VYVGARSRTEFYDVDAIEKLVASCPWLRVTYVVNADPSRPGEFFSVVDRALADGDWRGRHVFVCGSDLMVSSAVSGLTQAGYHTGQLHYEALGGQWYAPGRRVGDVQEQRAADGGTQ
ncbi:globin, partial [Plantactinospora sp. S1510]|nr:globin [Plantactinospora alkalitolerans]